jgi:hypothetical protein
MKCQPDPDTTAEQKYNAFRTDLRHALTFSKADLRNAEDAYKRERSTHPKRGPKPSSGRASSGKG